MEREKLLEQAQSQLGLLTTAQIEAADAVGFMRGRVAAGEWVKIHRGLYKVGPGPLTPEQHLLATQLIACPEAVLSHLTAARLHGLHVPHAQLVDVTVPHERRPPRFDDARIHRTRDLPADQIVTKGALRLTSVVWTVMSCVPVLETSGHWVPTLVYSFARKYQAFVDDLVLTLKEKGSGRAGANRLFALLQEHSGDRALPMSVAESFFRDVVRAVGIKPRAQYRFGKRQTVDFSWPEHRVLVEVDSQTFHNTYVAYHTDRTRDRNAVTAGWVTLRYTWKDIAADKNKIISEIQTVLAARNPQQALAY